MALHKIAVGNLNKGKFRTTKKQVCLSYHALQRAALLKKS